MCSLGTQGFRHSRRKDLTPMTTQLVGTSDPEIANETGALRAAATIAIPLSMLGIAQDHLLRPIDQENVVGLVDSDEQKWDPIEVRLWPAEWPKPAESVKYHVVSGNHRTTAAHLKNLACLNAIVIEAKGDIAYLEAGIKTNVRHGKNFSSEEKRLLALKLKKLGKSGNEIATLLSVSKSTANNWISGRDTNAARKRRAVEVQETRSNTLIDWDVVPDINAARIAKVGSDISDFLATTPVDIDKAQIAGWVQS